MELNWIPLVGNFEVAGDTVVFHGEEETSEGGQTLHAVGTLLSNQFFGGGVIEADVEFLSLTGNELCGLVLFYQPANQSFIEAQLGGDFLASVWSFADGQWYGHGSTGLARLLQQGRSYHIRVAALGSSVAVNVDGVDLLKSTLPIPLPRGQAGIWCRGRSDIRISHFKVQPADPTVFVVMQFTPPYNELYSEVIKPVCQSLGFSVRRADETLGPGVIIRDIEDQIVKARVVIADVTPKNPNVYYEVGFAHALAKPTILIAESPTQLPFDVSPFRVLFYENTIGGKAKIEAGLRGHLEAVKAQAS